MRPHAADTNVRPSRALLRWNALAALLAASGLFLGCDGFAAPIVGVRGSDGGPPGCREAVPCRPWRTVPPERFAPPPWSPPADCDLDGVLDDLDNCPGVPNAWQDDLCGAARAACARLQAADGALEGADLRGCAASVALHGDLALAGADLSCSQLRVEGEGRLVLRGARVAGATLDIRGLRVDADDLLLVGSSLTLADGATLRGARALVAESHVRIASPDGVTDDAVAALDLVACEVREAAIEVADPTRPARLRLDECDLDGSHLVARTIEGVRGVWDGVALDATDLLVLGATLRRSVVRAEYAAFAAVATSDVVFERCGTITFSGSRLRDVDIPPCAPAGLTLERSDVDVSRLGGGVRMIGGVARDSVIGAVGASVETIGADFTHVRFCAPARGRFLDGNLTCSACDDGDFGEGICRRGPRRTSENCSALEHASPCAEGVTP